MFDVRRTGGMLNCSALLGATYWQRRHQRQSLCRTGTHRKAFAKQLDQHSKESNAMVGQSVLASFIAIRALRAMRVTDAGSFHLEAWFEGPFALVAPMQFAHLGEHCNGKPQGSIGSPCKRLRARRNNHNYNS